MEKPPSIPELLKLLELKNYELRRTRQLATKKGFIEAYFEACATEKTNKSAFQKIADEYQEIFGAPAPFTEYDSVQKHLKRIYRKQN